MTKNIPKASSPAVFKTMSGNRGKDSKLEIVVRKALWRDRYRYRKNNPRLFGTPDISFPKLKIVVFLDSCYWHGCPIHFKMPKTNTFFWHQKINRNIERDSEVSNHYLQENWILLRFWEHEVKQDLERVVKTIEYFVDEKREK